AAPVFPQSPLIGKLDVPQKQLTVFGLRTTYYEAGSGRTLILLANLGWDAHFWFRNFGELAKSSHVIALDLVGQGGSEKPMIDYKMQTWTDWIAEFMRLKGIRKATVGGAVMGGALGVQFALDHPELSEGIIVAASNTGPGHPAVKIAPEIPSTLSAVRRENERYFYDKSLVTDEFVRARFAYRLEANDGYVILRHLSDHRDPYSVEELSRMHVPALVIWCNQDEVTPLSWGRAYAAAIPGAQLVTIDGCGHYPNLERPHQFNEAVNSFLRNGAPAP